MMQPLGASGELFFLIQSLVYKLDKKRERERERLLLLMRKARLIFQSLHMLVISSVKKLPCEC